MVMLAIAGFQYVPVYDRKWLIGKHADNKQSKAKQEANRIDTFEPHISTAEDQQEVKKEGLSDEEFAHIKDNRRRKIV